MSDGFGTLRTTSSKPNTPASGQSFACSVGAPVDRVPGSAVPMSERSCQRAASAGEALACGRVVPATSYQVMRPSKYETVAGRETGMCLGRPRNLVRRAPVPTTMRSRGVVPAHEVGGEAVGLADAREEPDQAAHRRLVGPEHALDPSVRPRMRRAREHVPHAAAANALCTALDRKTGPRSLSSRSGDPSVWNARAKTWATRAPFGHHATRSSATRRLPW